MALSGAEQSDHHNNSNIVMFPFMAQGHIIPFLALAFHIEQTQKNCRITFINTKLNIQKLRSSLPPNSTIRLLEIPFDSSEHGLPPSTENTDVLPYPLIVRLLDASTSLRPAFRALVRDLIAGGDRPLCVIADIFFGWTATVAKELGVFHAVFSGAGGFGLACYYSIWTSLPPRDSEEFKLEDFNQIRVQKTQLPLSVLEADGSDDWSLFQKKNLPAWVDSDGILFNTVEEFDSIGLSYFRKKLGIPTWAIGPVLLSTESSDRAGKESGVSSNSCKAWLDGKPEKSVLYVSFGSHNTISPAQMMELGKALESSGRNFIWVVRPPIGFDINSEFRAEEWLPEGFEEKTSGRGLLVKKWAPQVEILSHGATGGFLTHCGWNSVLESLSFGVPMIGWAMAGEQFFNVKFLEEELGVCVEAARGKTCEVSCEGLRGKIEMVMNTEKEEGIEIRRKALEVKEMMRKAMNDGSDSGAGRKGSSLKALDEFFMAANESMRSTAERPADEL